MTSHLHKGTHFISEPRPVLSLGTSRSWGLPLFPVGKLRPRDALREERATWEGPAGLELSQSAPSALHGHGVSPSRAGIGHLIYFLGTASFHCCCFCNFLLSSEKACVLTIGDTGLNRGPRPPPSASFPGFAAKTRRPAGYKEGEARLLLHSETQISH